MIWYNGYWLAILAAIFALVAQIKVKTTFKRYSSEQNQHGYTAKEVARKILDENGLQYISIEYVSGELTDHYDPTANVIRLSDSVYGSTSVAAIGVAAHEVGHAIQHAQGYAPIKLRQAVIPLTRIGSNLALPLVFLGLFISAFRVLVPVGIFLYAGVAFFQAVTLPVEFDASNRALKTLDENLILYKEEVQMAKKVLGAAAMTYVAAMFSSLVTLLRLILIANGGGRRRR